MCVDSLSLFELPVSGGPRSARVRTRCRLCFGCLRAAYGRERARACLSSGGKGLIR